MNNKLTGLVAGAAGAALLLGGSTYALWSDSADVDGGVITAGNLDVEVLGSGWFDTSADRTDNPHPIILDEVASGAAPLTARTGGGHEDSGGTGHDEHGNGWGWGHCWGGWNWGHCDDEDPGDDNPTDPDPETPTEVCNIAIEEEPEVPFRIIPGDTISGCYGIDLGLEGENLVANLSVDSDVLTGPLAPALNVGYQILDADGTELASGSGTGDDFEMAFASSDNGNPGALAVVPETEPDGTADLQLLVTVEFPDSVSDQDFVQLQAELAGTSVGLQQVRADVDGYESSSL